MTSLGILGNYPGDGGYGLNIVSYVFVPNSKSVVHFVLVDFGEDVLLLVLVLVTGGKQSQLLVRLGLDC